MCVPRSKALALVLVPDGDGRENEEHGVGNVDNVNDATIINDKRGAIMVGIVLVNTRGRNDNKTGKFQVCVVSGHHHHQSIRCQR